MKNQKIAIFHIGRGGRFNNPGYTRAKMITDQFEAGYYGINIYFSFENITPEIVEICEENQFYISDAACNWDQEEKNIFDNLNIVIEGDKITADDLGNPVVRSEQGEQLCTIDEYNSLEGRIELDYDYDTYYWKPVDKLDEDEVNLIKRDLREWEYQDLIS